LAAKSAPKKNLSAIKRDRQAEKRNERNRTERTKIKGVIKTVEASVKAGEKDLSTSALQKAIKAINSSKSKGIIHKNNASRKISRLTRKVNSLSKAAEA
jgi:small subunit ribosomal protein S20